MGKIENEYKNKGLEKLHPRKHGNTPRTYCNCKWKDPVNKRRVITTYCGHSLEKIMRWAGKALRWILQQISKAHTNFTMHNISNIKSTFKKSKRKMIREIWQKYTLNAFPIRC